MQKIADNFVLDSKLLSLVEGKRVALVGPAPYLVNSGLGAEIDGYDVVCRVTDLMPPYEKDYGSRTDVLFDACDYRGVGNGIQKLRRNEKVARAIKLLYLPWADLDEAAHVPRDSIFTVRQKIYSDSGFDLPWSYVGEQNFALIQNEIGCEPNSGMLAMAILLSHRVKELLITGMTFYLDTGNDPRRCYYPNYLEGGLEKLMDNSDFLDGHQQLPQVVFFVTEIVRIFSETIRMDSYVQDLLNKYDVALTEYFKELEAPKTTE